MQPQLYAHPFSSYCQKVLIALYENGTSFDFRELAHDDAATAAEFARLWPLKRMPVLVDHGRTIVESSTIIEYLARHYPGHVQLIPADAEAALEARMLDRVFDNYVMTPMQKIVFDCIRAEADRDPFGVRQARDMLNTSYRWLDQTLRRKGWAAGEGFSLADCAAAPALFFADWVQEIPPALANLRGYRARLLARPSFSRCVEEARPYRGFFPPGAPDRD
jgi:glutathione S-transferase